ncbi:MAG TPA: hypothetical protein VKT27_10600 [Candidatus Binataceae bacterium]|nr:hypothetical protein [Candidatus Binataceae bacterium]
MGEVIRLEEIDRARARRRVRAAEREHLERAVGVLRDNLAAAAAALRDTSDPARQAEMLARVERLAAMVRYGMRMLGEAPEDGTGSSASRVAGPR